MQTNFLYVNNTAANLTAWHAEIAAALRTTGELPEELRDLFTVRRVNENPDGSPRFMIDEAE